MFGRFDTIPDGDRQIYGQADGQTSRDCILKF